MGALKFIIKADSLFNSNNFTVYDDAETPWLHWEGRNVDDDGGEAALFRSAAGTGEAPLVRVQVSGLQFVEESFTDKDDHAGWFSDGDKKTKLKWKIVRSVRVATHVRQEGDTRSFGSEPEFCGELLCEFQGIAEAKQDVDYDGDGARKVKWKKKARTQRLDYKMSIEGRPVGVEMSPGQDSVSMWDLDDRKGWAWGQTYDCGPFKVEYVSKTGCDDVKISTQGVMNPSVAVALGFSLSYWMHPKRVEDDAADRAMKILSSRLSW